MTADWLRRYYNRHFVKATEHGEENTDMELRTERLLLKPLGMQYLESVHEYSSDIENTKYMVHLPRTSMEETADFLRGIEAEWKKESPLFYELAILYDEKQIGAVSIYKTDDETGELGWILNKKYWNRGIITEAATALISFAQNDLGIHRFIAHCDTENTGSRRIMEKLGMKQTAINGGRKNKSSDEERMEYQYELSF